MKKMIRIILALVCMNVLSVCADTLGDVVTSAKQLKQNRALKLGKSPDQMVVLVATIKKKPVDMKSAELLAKMAVGWESGYKGNDKKLKAQLAKLKQSTARVLEDAKKRLRTVDPVAGANYDIKNANAVITKLTDDIKKIDGQIKKAKGAQKTNLQKTRKAKQAELDKQNKLLAQAENVLAKAKKPAPIVPVIAKPTTVVPVPPMPAVVSVKPPVAPTPAPEPAPEPAPKPVAVPVAAPVVAPPPAPPAPTPKPLPVSTIVVKPVPAPTPSGAPPPPPPPSFARPTPTHEAWTERGAFLAEVQKGFKLRKVGEPVEPTPAPKPAPEPAPKPISVPVAAPVVAPTPVPALAPTLSPVSVPRPAPAPVPVPTPAPTPSGAPVPLPPPPPLPAGFGQVPPPPPPPPGFGRAGTPPPPPLLPASMKKPATPAAPAESITEQLKKRAESGEKLRPIEPRAKSPTPQEAHLAEIRGSVTKEDVEKLLKAYEDNEFAAYDSERKKSLDELITHLRSPESSLENKIGELSRLQMMTVTRALQFLDKPASVGSSAAELTKLSLETVTQAIDKVRVSVAKEEAKIVLAILGADAAGKKFLKEWNDLSKEQARKKIIEFSEKWLKEWDKFTEEQKKAIASVAQAQTMSFEGQLASVLARRRPFIASEPEEEETWGD